MSTQSTTTDEGVGAVGRSVRVRAHELAPRVGDLAANVAAIRAAIHSAVSEGVHLLVLPELATSGYYLRDVDEAIGVALASNDQVFREWAELLTPEMTVVVGFCELLDGVLYNSAAVLTREGLAAVYRKTHLWDSEQTLFEAGSEPPAVLDTPVGRLGVLVCYDLEFPEMPRSLALRGAEIIAVPTNWPTVPRPEGEHPPEVVQAMAAARSSGVAIVCCDRSGDERGHTWTQGTSIVGCDGWLSGTKDTLGRVDSVIRIERTRTVLGPFNDVFSDRRPDLYAEALFSSE